MGVRRIINVNGSEMTIKMRFLLSRLILCHLLMITNQVIPKLIIKINPIPSTKIRRVLFSLEEITNRWSFDPIGTA
jgi:hypothetical protein